MEPHYLINLANLKLFFVFLELFINDSFNLDIVYMDLL